LRRKFGDAARRRRLIEDRAFGARLDKLSRDADVQGNAAS
jgi:hypothetical protein